MKYTMSQRGEVDKLFKKYFKIGISQFYDGMLTSVFKKISIDMFKFDNWIHDQVGDYESKGESLHTILIKTYGQEASDLIESLI